MSGWFYNDVSGTLNRVPTLLEAPYLIPGTGWHELHISYNATLAQAKAEAAKEFPTGATPGGGVAGNIAGQAAQATGGASFLAPLGDVGNFFHALTQSSTWVRVGEVALGGILIYVGARALSQGSSAVGAQARKPVTRGARRVVKSAASIAVPEARLATRTVAKRVAPETTKRVAAHRAQVRKYGARKPYEPPKPRQPIVHKVERTSTIIHKKA